VSDAVQPVAKPALTTTSLSRPWWEAAAAGVLLVQVCSACGNAQHYPRILCSSCWALELQWTEAGGLGEVRAFTVVHMPGHPGWADDSPYVIALVWLDEGPTMMTRIVDVTPSDVHVGQRVVFSSRVLSDGEAQLPVFSPVAS